MGVMIKKEENPPDERSLGIQPTYYRPSYIERSWFPTMSFPEQNSNGLRNLTPVLPIILPALPSYNQQLRTRPTPEFTLDSSQSGRYIVRLPQQLDQEIDEIDPAKFDPADISFKQVCRTLAPCNLDKHGKFLRDTMLNYSLCIQGFPDCPKDDLMLAVYFYFEEKFKIKTKFELCVRFDHGHEKNLVGVLFSSLKTRDEVYVKANTSDANESKGSEIKITPCEHFFWIPDGFCGP